MTLTPAPFKTDSINQLPTKNEQKMGFYQNNTPSDSVKRFSDVTEDKGNITQPNNTMQNIIDRLDYIIEEAEKGIIEFEKYI